MVNSKALQARADGLKIPQKEVAAKVGISQSALSKKGECVWAIGPSEGKAG